MNLEGNLDKELIAQKIAKVVNLLKEAGYDPYDQLAGYMKTGSELYITRYGNARRLIREIDTQHIGDYLKGVK